MLSNDDMQRLQRLVNLAPLMTQEMRQELLELVRKLKAAEGQACGLPASAIADLERAVPTELVQAIVEDQRHGVGVPGWLPPSKSEPVVRGTGWQSPAWNLSTYRGECLTFPFLPPPPITKTKKGWTSLLQNLEKAAP